MTTVSEFIPSLSDIIHRICEGIPDEGELIPFIRLCTRLAMGYLRMKIAKGYRIGESLFMTDSEMEDIAVDCLADLFERNQTGEYVQLRRYFQPQLASTEDAESWLIAVRKLVVSRTEQALYRIFRERDPETAKIYRNIKLAVIHHPELELHNTPSATLIIIDQTKTLRHSHSPGIDALAFEAMTPRLLAELSASDTIPELIQKCLTVIRSCKNPPYAVTLASMATLLSRFRIEIQRADGRISQDAENPDESLVKNELRQKLKQLQKSLFKKIDDDYVKTRKINPDTALGLKNAISDITEDMLHGDTDQSYYQYINTHLPKLTSQEYRENLRTRFEYFMKCFKSDIHGLLKSYSESS